MTEQPKPVLKPVEDPDVLLCRKIAIESGVPAKEAECIPILKAFGQHNDFDRTASELAKIVGKTPAEVISIAGKALNPASTTAKAE